MEKTYNIGKAELGSWVKEYVKLNGNSAEHLFYKYTGNSVDNLLNFEDIINATSCREMFMDAKNLKAIPLINTYNVKNMGSMFYNCASLITIPLLNTSKTTNMYGMFNSCRNLKAIPLLNTYNVKNMSGMFSGCNALTIIPSLDCNIVNDFNNFVSGCPNVEEINLLNVNANLDIAPCQKMQQPALHKLIDNLLPQTSGRKTLTMGATLLDRVSAEYKSKADAKGWDLK